MKTKKHKCKKCGLKYRWYHNFCRKDKKLLEQQTKSTIAIPNNIRLGTVIRCKNCNIQYLATPITCEYHKISCKKPLHKNYVWGKKEK